MGHNLCQAESAQKVTEALCSVAKVITRVGVHAEREEERSDGMRILLLLSRFKKKASSCSIFIKNRAQIKEFEGRKLFFLSLNLIFDNMR